MTERQGCIYVIREQFTGQVCYVGQTRQKPSRRFSQHKNSSAQVIGRALQMFGGDSAFDFEVIETISAKKLNEREIFWIDAYDTVWPRGLNRRSGGLFCDEALERMSEAAKRRCTEEWRAAASERSKRQMTEEVRAELSRLATEQMKDPAQREASAEGARRQWQDPAMRERLIAHRKEFGKQRWQDPEYRAHMISIATGRKPSAESLKRMSEAQKGHPVTEATRAKLRAKALGRKASEETKKALREAAAARVISDELRAVYSEAGKRAAAKRWARYREEKAKANG